VAVWNLRTKGPEGKDTRRLVVAVCWAAPHRLHGLRFGAGEVAGESRYSWEHIRLRKHFLQPTLVSFAWRNKHTINKNNLLTMPFEKLKISNPALQYASRSKKGWESIPDPQHALYQELQKMYWDGIKRELKQIILTLQTWQSPEFADIGLPAQDAEMTGFDTFIDQVSESSREFAMQYCSCEPN